jgi:hypothetical protein
MRYLSHFSLYLAFEGSYCTEPIFQTRLKFSVFVYKQYCIFSTSCTDGFKHSSHTFYIFQYICNSSYFAQIITLSRLIVCLILFQSTKLLIHIYCMTSQLDQNAAPDIDMYCTTGPQTLVPLFVVCKICPYIVSFFG